MLKIMKRPAQQSNCLFSASLATGSVCPLLCTAVAPLQTRPSQALFSALGYIGLAVALFIAIPAVADDRTGAPFFDTHLHYNAADAELFPAANIIARLQQNRVAYAAVTSTPAEHSLALYQHAPQQIIPILGAYRSLADKISWVNDTQLPARLAVQLKQGPWRGIGELHIFADDRHSPVFKRIIQLAREHQLPLLIHGDPAVIDTLYQIAPAITVIWAHGGTFAYPDLLADYLRRYPGLMVDLSVRDSRIAPQGELDDAWYQLFIRYPERFLLGIDTYAPGRWQNYADALAKIRHWLGQLPEGVAHRMAFQNAIKVYRIEKTQHNEQQYE
jgi:hypothetical protein